MSAMASYVPTPKGPDFTTSCKMSVNPTDIGSQASTHRDDLQQLIPIFELSQCLGLEDAQDVKKILYSLKVLCVGDLVVLRDHQDLMLALLDFCHILR
jgi:hypothetical protein